jgi:MscS family membrane protein
VLLLVLLAPNSLAWAQAGRGLLAPPAAKTEQVDQPAQAPKDALGRDTPRGTVLGFMTAARNGTDGVSPLYLNTNVPAPDAAELARMLYVVLDSRLPVRLNELSDRPEGTPDNPLKPNEDVVGTIQTANGPFDLVLERVTPPGSPPVWLFSPETLSFIPEAYDEVDLVRLDRFLPAFLAKPRIAGVRLFEWLAMFLLLPLCYRLLGLLGLPFKRRVPGLVRLLLLGIGVRWVVSSLDLPLFERQFWWATSGLLMIAAAGWLLLRLNEYAEARVSRRLAATGEMTSLLRLARRVGDVLAIAACLLVVLRYFGFNPTAALAGLGIGGIAVALAAQKTLENVVAGLSMIFDKAVRVGDVLRFSGTVGIVDYIGLRSTRIRTLDRTILSVPNGQIAGVGIETLSARDKFLFRHVVTLRYGTTVAQMRAVIDGVTGMLVADASVDAPSVRVRFFRLGAFSLDLEVFAYVFAADWEPFLEIQQELLLRVMELIEGSGTAIAIPSQTLHIAGEPSPSVDRLPRARNVS